jgi:hypothetical protein
MQLKAGSAAASGCGSAPRAEQEGIGRRVYFTRKSETRGRVSQRPGRARSHFQLLGCGFRRFGSRVKAELVCLAGVVNYRDERSPTEAMTPTVAEG